MSVNSKKGEMFQVMYLKHLIQFGYAGYAWDMSLFDFRHKIHDFVLKLFRSF